jgi:hypothetical protein
MPLPLSVETVTGETATPDQATTPAAVETPSETDWKAESERWKANSRKNEANAKANADKAKAWDDYQASQKTADQQAADQIASLTAQNTELERRAMRAEVAAAHGVPAERLVGTTLEELDADAVALAQLLNKPAPQPGPPPAIGLGQRGEPISGTDQITSADVITSMDPDAVAAALKAGRFNEILMNG